MTELTGQNKSNVQSNHQIDHQSSIKSWLSCIRALWLIKINNVKCQRRKFVGCCCYNHDS